MVFKERANGIGGSPQDLETTRSWQKTRFLFIVYFTTPFLDVRALVGDDELMDGGILAALEEYNTEELATVEVPGIEGKVQLTDER